MLHYGSYVTRNTIRIVNIHEFERFDERLKYVAVSRGADVGAVVKNNKCSVVFWSPR